MCGSGIFKVSTSLETLNLHMCGGIWDQAPFPSLPNLKNLRITYSRLSEKDLKAILSCCNGLCTFVYEAADPCSIPNSRDHFHASSIIKYLSYYHETLKSLKLDLRRLRWSPVSNGQNTQAAFSFQAFTALEHLFLNSSELYSCFLTESPAESLLVQRLPPSITTLRLAGHIGYGLPHLAKGLLALADAALQGQFPRLEQVRCDAEQNLDEHHVSTMFSAAGVDFGYSRWPLGEATLRDSDVPPLSTPSPHLPLPSDTDSDL
ncbi:hypothetical protein EYZ11_009274 [Aspergillus tanneri]|uniref:F-box domain-containing protein n=1 Tax=Aspergillus tanneri TaxID=1220188 RepID=A0A4S3J8P7_9EURO|nr:uncharacterized protein ATNIH1004_000577 [Aspergillus tanneri]KAA8651681.1 hypothetical protein ATNIH1004_000577 [Aspergillus tanneri]THC91255.1 hypothetical protein EYZ11_009274 [Aspergillus tanneri]